MKLTKERLKEIIKEELSEARVVDYFGDEKDRAVATRQAEKAAERDADPKKKAARQKKLDDFFSIKKEEEEVNEAPSVEHITPENIKLVLDALAQVGMLLAPTAVAAAAIQKGLSKRVKKKKPEVKEGWYGYSKRGNWRNRKRSELEYELGDEDTRSHDPLRSFKRRAAIGRKTLNDMLSHLQSQGQGPGDEDYDFVKRKLDTSKWRKWYMEQDDYDRLAQLLDSDLFNSAKNIQYKFAPWTHFKVG